TPQPTLLLNAAKVVDLIVLGSAVAVLGHRWGRRRNAPTGWALAMFAVFGAVVVAGFFKVTDDGSLLRHGYTVALICVLLLVPYFLVRFAYSLGALSRRSHQVALGLTATQMLVTVASPRFPQPGEPRTAWFLVFLLLFLVGWTTQSVVSAAGLWRAGNGQPSVVRHRMRALGLGAVVISVALVAGSGSGNPGATSQLITTLIGMTGVCLIVLAFLVPSWLRSAWRAADLIELGAAERQLMAAATATQVADAIVPAVVRLFGARGAALLDRGGDALAMVGLTAEQKSSIFAEVSRSDVRLIVVVTRDGGFACRLTDGWLVLQAGAFAPLFGPAEELLLDRVGSFVDLALQRCRLFEQEARSRQAAEAATAELQTLIYSVSHDLRNPIISVLGYLDVLAQEHAGELQGEGGHYLDRISVNALYMQNLIQDLLELSRIGRSEPAAQAVDLGSLAESVAQEVRIMQPGTAVDVSGSFPVVWMSELRARQLLTNLIDNGAKHSPAQAHVSVLALDDGSGGALLLISDNGKGIPVQYREKAFEVFERLEGAHGSVPGTGMGLPICKRIVESIGGTIVLDGPSPGLNSGTTVRVSLPTTVVRSWTAPLSTSPIEEPAR
nr:HAMP domain-containing histidine kinase [Actinomycetota bacterium]